MDFEVGHPYRTVTDHFIKALVIFIFYPRLVHGGLQFPNRVKIHSDSLDIATLPEAWLFSITTFVILAFQNKFQNISHFNIRTEKPTYCGFHNFLVRFAIVRIFLNSKIFNNNARMFIEWSNSNTMQEGSNLWRLENRSLRPP